MCAASPSPSRKASVHRPTPPPCDRVNAQHVIISVHGAQLTNLVCAPQTLTAPLVIMIIHLIFFSLCIYIFIYIIYICTLYILYIIKKYDLFGISLLSKSLQFSCLIFERKSPFQVHEVVSKPGVKNMELKFIGGKSVPLTFSEIKIINFRLQWKLVKNHLDFHHLVIGFPATP